MTRFISLAVLTLALGGCASQPKTSDDVVVVNPPVKPDFRVPVQPNPVINEDCALLAKTARAIALARDAGIPAMHVELVVEPQKVFPVGPVIREVFLRRDITPADGAQNSYRVCMNVTFPVMLSNLMAADESYNAALKREMVDTFIVKRRAAQAAPDYVAPAPKPLKLKIDPKSGK